MKKGIYIKDNKIMIQGRKLLAVITPEELLKAITENENIFYSACKRGKSELRIIANETRNMTPEEKNNYLKANYKMLTRNN